MAPSFMPSSRSQIEVIKNTSQAEVTGKTEGVNAEEVSAPNEQTEDGKAAKLSSQFFCVRWLEPEYRH